MGAMKSPPLTKKLITVMYMSTIAASLTTELLNHLPARIS